MTASTWTLRIPGWHPAPLNRLMHGHWSNGARLKKSDREQISMACRVGGVPAAEGRRAVALLLVLGKGQRACDPDAYSKSLLDGLVQAGALRDDNRNWVEWRPVQFARGDVKEAIITLEDVK